MFLSYINTLSSAILSYSSITFRGKVIQGEKNGKGRGGEKKGKFLYKKSREANCSLPCSREVNLYLKSLISRLW